MEMAILFQTYSLSLSLYNIYELNFLSLFFPAQEVIKHST